MRGGRSVDRLYEDDLFQGFQGAERILCPLPHPASVHMTLLREENEGSYFDGFVGQENVRLGNVFREIQMTILWGSGFKGN